MASSVPARPVYGANGQCVNLNAPGLLNNLVILAFTTILYIWIDDALRLFTGAYAGA